MGDTFTVADAYLFNMLTLDDVHRHRPGPMARAAGVLRARPGAPAVQAALAAEKAVSASH